MAEENQRNTVATVGMWFSIIWVIALITIIFSFLWLPLLFVWLILWIIGLFYKPRTRARIAVCIPLIVFITIASVIGWIWSSVKTPATQFIDWAKVEFENIDEETFDKERFNAIINEEFNNMLSSIDEEEFTSMIENNTWSNILEKLAYTVFALGQEGLENSLEKYNNGYTPEINEENQPITIDIENNEDENVEELENNEEINEEEVEEAENTDTESIETSDESEENNIEEILNTLE